MKITCEIDWVSEDQASTLDDILKQEVIEKVVEHIATRFSTEMFKEVEKKASNELATRVNEILNRILERFTKRQIKVTDKWGDIQAEYEDVNELLKSKFDDFLTEKVNKNGSPSTSCYIETPYTRLDFILDKRIREESDKLTKEIASMVNKKIEAQKAQIHKQAIEKITKKLGLDV